MEQNKIRKIVKPVSEIKPKGVDLPEAEKPKGDLEGLKKIKKVKKKKKEKAAGGGGTVLADNTNYNAITEAIDGAEKSM